MDHLDSILTDQHRHALHALVSAFDELVIPYQITGGLAGNIHGSTWPVHDIDIDVRQVDLPKLSAYFASAIVQPVARVVDEEFDLYLLTLGIGGVSVDISQIEDAYIFENGRRTPLVIDLAKAERHTLAGVQVWVQPLDDLIAYKARLGRIADVRDLSAVKFHRGHR
jgi:hypothetical protein